MRALILLLAAGAAHAGGTLYRCDSPGGGVEYRDRPCSSGTQRPVDTSNARYLFTYAAPPAIDPAPPARVQQVLPAPAPEPVPQVVVIIQQQAAAPAWPLWWPYVQAHRHPSRRTVVDLPRLRDHNGNR